MSLLRRYAATSGPTFEFTSRITDSTPAKAPTAHRTDRASRMTPRRWREFTTSHLVGAEPGSRGIHRCQGVLGVIHVYVSGVLLFTCTCLPCVTCVAHTAPRGRARTEDAARAVAF